MTRTESTDIFFTNIEYRHFNIEYKDEVIFIVCIYFFQKKFILSILNIYFHLKGIDFLRDIFTRNPLPKKLGSRFFTEWIEHSNFNDKHVDLWYKLAKFYFRFLSLFKKSMIFIDGIRSFVLPVLYEGPCLSIIDLITIPVELFIKTKYIELLSSICCFERKWKKYRCVLPGRGYNERQVYHLIIISFDFEIFKIRKEECSKFGIWWAKADWSYDNDSIRKIPC